MTRVLIVGAGITGAVTASLLKCRLPQKSHIAVWELSKRAGGCVGGSTYSSIVNVARQYTLTGLFGSCPP